MRPAPPRTSSRTRHAVPAIAVALGLWLVAAALAATLLWQEREREMEKGRLAAAATTALMEAHTANTFHAVHLALRDISNRLEAAPLGSHDDAFRATMRSRVEGMPYVRALFVIGPDGFIQHDTDYPRTPQVSLADRDYFVHHRDTAGDATSVGAPLLSRSGTGWFIPVTQRLGEGNGFKGVVVAAIQLRYFSELYERMGLGPGYHLALFHRDGRLIAQHPPEGGVIGRSYADYPLFRLHLRSREQGVYLSSGDPLPYERIFSYASVQQSPLVVALARESRQALGGWRASAETAAMVLGLFAMVLAVATLLFLRLQSERRQARERQAQGEKMEALGQLTGSIAHDFGNLLGIVSGNLELVRRAGLADGRTGLAVARAQRAVDSGAALTQHLMSFARKRELKPQPHDLCEVLRSALPLLEQAAGSGVHVTLDAPSEAVWGCVDRSQLEVALINLVVNARDAMQGRGSVVPRAETVSRRAGGLALLRPRTLQFAALCVEDDGPGMPEQVRQRALEPFFTTKGEGGTGLGLAQVHGLVHQLGGEVEIDSAPGRGTRVHLLFPAIR